MVSFDNLRTPLPRPIGPADEVTIPLVVAMPETPGAYCLQVDLVHEGITWFADRGGEPCVVKVLVT